MIIGINGQSQAGKDTAAVHLVEKYKFVQMSFAGPIKEFGSKVFNFTDKQLYGPSKNRDLIDERFPIFYKPALYNFYRFAPEWIETLGDYDKKHCMEKLEQWFVWLTENHRNLSPRIALQTLGTEWGRETIGEDIWVKCLLYRSDKAIEDGAKGVVISDVRFPNEVTALKNHGAKIIRILREKTDKNALSSGVAGHASEADQSKIDPKDINIIIENNETITKLKKKLDEYVSTLDL